MLPSSVDEVLFSGGLREHEDPWVQTQGFQVLHNCYEDRTGSVVKLSGYTEAPTTSRTGLVQALTLSEGGRLVKRGALVGSVCRGSLWAKLDEWTPQGHAPPFVCEQRTVIEAESARRIDSCIAGSWSFVVFEVLVGSRLQLRVAATHQSDSGETVIVSAAVSDASFDCFYPRIIQWSTEDGAALLAYARNGSVRFRRVKVNSAGAALGSEDAITVGLQSATAPQYDVQKADGATSFGLVAWTNLGTVVVGRGTFSATSLSAVTTQSVGGSPPDVTAVTVWSDTTSDRLAYAYSNWVVSGGSFRHRVRTGVRQFSSLGTTVIGELTAWQRTADSAVPPAQADSIRLLSSVGVPTSSSNATLIGYYFAFYDPNPPTALYGGEFSSGYVPTQRGVFVSTAGSASSPDYCGWTRMRSRPFYHDGRLYLLAELLLTDTLSSDQDSNRGYVLLSCFAGAAAQRFVPSGFVGHLQAPRANYYPSADDLPEHTRFSRPYQDSSGAWHAIGVEADAGTLRTRVRDYRFVPSDDRVGRFAELGGQTYIAGALLSAWDGLRCIEAGILRAPILFNPTHGAGALAAGTRSYRITYVRFSASGEQLRSFPSVTKTTTNTGVQDNRLQWTPLCVTATSDSDTLPWFAEIWRTTDGSTAPFYLLARVEMPPAQRDYMSYTDAVSDASLVLANGPTELAMNGSAGAELGNDPPISPLYVCEWRNRLWLTDGEQIQYSKEGAPSRAAEFSANFVMPRAIQQKLTAVAPHGDVLACFAEDQTAYVYGDGPAANGDGSSLTGPIVVPGELGCVYPAGLTSVPGGLLVPTRRGIQRFDIKRQYSYVGEGIEATLLLFPRIRDADYQLGDDLVWFVLGDTLATAGQFALFNLRTGAWSTAFSSATAATIPTTIRHVAGDQFWGSADGSCYRRTDGEYVLAGASYNMAARIPWVKRAGLAGEQRLRRLWLLGERANPPLTATALAVDIWYDYSDDAEDFTVSFSDADLTALDNGAQATLLRMAAPKQRCTSFSLQVREVNGVGVESAGFRLVAWRFETAQRRPKGAVVKPAPGGLA